MAKPKIADIEQALIDLVAADATVKQYIRVAETISVRSIEQDELGNQRLIVEWPAFLFLLESSQFSVADIGQTTYNYRLSFRIFAYTQNARGPIEEKRGGPGPGEVGVYQMLDDLKRILAGARLAISGVSSQPIVTLSGGGEALESMDPSGTVMSLAVTVETEFQA